MQFCIKLSKHERTVGGVVKHIAIGAGGLRFGFRAGQIEHSVANCSPPLRRLCISKELCRRDGLHHEFLRDTVSVMMI